jgi:hypothetical protein
LKPAALLLVLSLLLVLPVSAGEQYFEIYLSNETPTPNPTTSVANFTCTPREVVVGEAVSCSEVVKFMADLTWYWGDGNTTYAKGGTISNHSYANPGVYTVTDRHAVGNTITMYRRTDYIRVAAAQTQDPTAEPTTEITTAPSPEPTIEQTPTNTPEITPAATPTGKTVIIEFGPTVAAMVDRIMQWIELILGVKTGQV